MSAASAISAVFARHPWSANGLSGGALALAGDVACQLGIEGAPAVDGRRAASMVAFGAAYTGPVCATLYASYPRVLARALPAARATPRREALACSALDNFAHLPFLCANRRGPTAAAGSRALHSAFARAQRRSPHRPPFSPLSLRRPPLTRPKIQ